MELRTYCYAARWLSNGLCMMGDMVPEHCVDRITETYLRTREQELSDALTYSCSVCGSSTDRHDPQCLLYSNDSGGPMALIRRPRQRLSPY